MRLTWSNLFINHVRPTFVSSKFLKYDPNGLLEFHLDFGTSNTHTHKKIIEAWWGPLMKNLNHLDTNAHLIDGPSLNLKVGPVSQADYL